MMRNFLFKPLILGCTFTLIFINCQQTQKRHQFCPYAVGDHLEYRNNWQLNYENGIKEKSKVFIIYEVLDVAYDDTNSVVKLKRYYSDVNGTSEDSILNIYSPKKVYIIRPDKSKDSLAFTLGDNQVRTLQDVTDSTGMRQVVKLVDNNASVSNSKGYQFDGCLKLTTAVYDINSPKNEFVFEKTSYFKNTILVKYQSTDRRQEEIGIKELVVESELEEFNIFAWR
jgi:dipeptidyl aminopeptidase/acylaminoacyl peptidase